MLNFVRKWFIKSFTRVVRQYWLNGKCSYSILSGGGKFYIREEVSGLVLFNRPYGSLEEAVSEVGKLAEFRFGSNPHYTLQDGLTFGNK